MKLPQSIPRGFRPGAIPGWIRALVCASPLLFVPPPLFAQVNHEWYKTQPNVLPNLSDNQKVADEAAPQIPPPKSKTCSIDPYRALPYTVSAATLLMPAKAQKEYDQACAALRNNDLAKSEEHLRKALEIYPTYAAGWVMFGQVLEARQEMDDARNACSRASTTDPKYLPAYLCLAEIAGRAQEWNTVLNLTDRALALDPMNDAYAYFFSAIAYFNLDLLPEAETRALKAEAIDKQRQVPFIEYLLGQIYSAKRDSAAAAAHLREFLTLAPDAPDVDRVKKELADLEGAK